MFKMLKMLKMFKMFKMLKMFKMFKPVSSRGKYSQEMLKADIPTVSDIPQC